MEKIILEGVEIQFNDFSEEVQEKLYLQNKKKFQNDAAISEYANIRRLLIKDEECEPSILDVIFKVETESYGDFENLNLLWNHPNFGKTDEKRKGLVESDSCDFRMMAAEEETDSSRLNEMLQKELQGENDPDVKEAIIENSNFRLEEETIKVLANSGNWTERVMAAKEETDSSRLNEMLIRELQGKNDDDVKQAIIENSNFRIEEETIEALANSNYWEERAMAAKEETDSSRLNEMLIRELQGKNDDDDVKKAIIGNSNFRMEEETIKALVNSGNWEDHLIIANDKNVSIEVLEKMYLNESDTDILQAIENNMDERVISKKVQLSYIQKVKIMRVLTKVRYSGYKYPISKYLNEILEIIG